MFRTRWTFSEAVMVSVGMSKLGLWDLIFGGLYTMIQKTRPLALCRIALLFHVFSQKSAKCEKDSVHTQQLCPHSTRCRPTHLTL